jgi:hypothetical protein
MPEHLHEIAATAPEHVEITSMGIAPERLLHLERWARTKSRVLPGPIGARPGWFLYARKHLWTGF